MTQKAEAKLVELAKAYSRHREALREKERAIRDLNAEAETFIDLKPYRNRYMSGEATDDPDCSIVWRGWLHAVDTCQEWDGMELEDDNIYRSMAKLLDEKKEISARGARIRNRLRIIGDQLRRAEP